MASLMLDPTMELLREEESWDRSAAGVAIFIAPGLFRHYELPVAVQARSVVANQFYLLPLLPLIDNHDRYLFLVLSRNGVRLFEGTRQGLFRLPIENIPASFDDYLQNNDEHRELQLHSGNRHFHIAGEKHRGAIFHGNGSARDQIKQELFQYFRMIDNELLKHIGHEGVPVVLGGLGYLLPIYRAATRYPYLVNGEVRGSLDKLNARQLHDLSWHIVASRLRRKQRAALEKLHRLLGTGLASTDPTEVVPAASFGRIESLFVTHSAEERDSSPERDEEFDFDAVVNAAAIETVANGGAIYAVPTEALDHAARLGAIFRY
jgi:hypothetical protein